MFLKLAKTYRQVVLFESDTSKIPLNNGRRECNAMIERAPSPQYAALFTRENKVVRLFDYLYFELRRVQTPAVNAFIQPFHACFYREYCHTGKELDAIGEMWGVSPERLFQAAREALEADMSAKEFEDALEACGFAYNRQNTQGALDLSLQVSKSYDEKTKELAALKAQMAVVEKEAEKLEALRDRSAVLAAVEACFMQPTKKAKH
jgi:hypothetical protein